MVILKFRQIPPIIIKKIVKEIGSNAFKDQTMLTNIRIHNNVINIGNNAFENCTNLKKVTVMKDLNNIIQLGTNAFYKCNLLEETIVPAYRVLEYKSATNWSNYSSYIQYTGSFPTLSLNCFSNLNQNTYLTAGKNRVYKLEVECGKSYKITSTAPSAIKMSLYDPNMNLISNSKDVFTEYLIPGTYYIDLKFDDNLASGTINTKYELRWPHNDWDILYDEDNNVLTHLHQIGANDYKNKLQYYNDKGAGFFEFNLGGINIDGSTPYYNEGAITIYSDSIRNNILCKFSGYSTEAKTSENLKRMVVYLPRGGYFYIDINMTSNNLESLDLRINLLVSQEVNLFNLSENTDESINIFNENTYGEYFQKLKINQAGRFTVNASYSGFQNKLYLF